ncbi:MAG: hypothetical protein DA328_02080, partial [Nitrososphaeraceae archaeon]|nr:hypothetical protein [Nitrososphaeraceae archaeon]
MLKSSYVFNIANLYMIYTNEKNFFFSFILVFGISLIVTFSIFHNHKNVYSEQIQYYDLFDDLNYDYLNNLQKFKSADFEFTTADSGYHDDFKIKKVKSNDNDFDVKSKIKDFKDRNNFDVKSKIKDLKDRDDFKIKKVKSKDLKDRDDFKIKKVKSKDLKDRDDFKIKKVKSNDNDFDVKSKIKDFKDRNNFDVKKFTNKDRNNFDVKSKIKDFKDRNNFDVKSKIKDFKDRNNFDVKKVQTRDFLNLDDLDFKDIKSLIEKSKFYKKFIEDEDEDKDKKISKDEEEEVKSSKNGDYYKSINYTEPYTGFNFAAVGDFGCNSNTKSTIKNIQGKEIDLLLALGDFSYTTDSACWLDTINPLKEKTKV